jgi:3-methyladenine DNA glycosylase AlkC
LKRHFIQGSLEAAFQQGSNRRLRQAADEAASPRCPWGNLPRAGAATRLILFGDA